MSSGMNRVILIGHLGQDPELRHTQSSSVLTLRLATSESYQTRDGERKERTDWHTIKLWGKRAEGLGRVLGKGERIAVEGSIQYEQWEDKQGNKRTSTVINARDIVLLGGRSDRGGGGRKQEDTSGGGWDDQGQGFPSDDFDDSGIPFIACYADDARDHDPCGKVMKVAKVTP